MSKRIFRSIFTVAIAVLIVSTVFIMSILYDYFTNEYSRMIKNDSTFIANGINLHGVSFLTSLPDTDDRLTLIASDGTVLYDNRADASKMENHSDREEIIEALANGSGESERYSQTISEKTYNYAILLEDGSILRLSNTRITIIALLLAMLQPILFIIIIAVILSGVLSAKVSRAIVKPINQINLDDPVPSEVYEELAPLLLRIAQQNKQIEFQMNELEQGDKLRREFTANVSHELKTPLTAISGTAEILQNGLVKAEDVSHFAGNIYNEAGRLITLVGDIIKLSQLDEKSVMLEKERVNLYNVAESTLERLKTTAKEKNISVKIAGEPAYTFGVRQIIDEMLFNLCDNAIKYNKYDGQVIITIKQTDMHAEVSVADTGIGIPEESRERVFERFYCVDKSHSKEIGGTGLGLSIVKHGAAYHNAEISLESKIGIGTTITILFQAAK